jgi:murein DD-endopeptidase MepM/ murein hydrolase activator NlpD
MQRYFLYALAFVASVITVINGNFLNAVAKDFSHPIDIPFSHVSIDNADKDVLTERMINPIQGEPIKLAAVGNTLLSYPFTKKYPISSGFGWRRHPITGKSSPHRGIDFPAPTGTPVLAARSGEVVLARWYGGFGNAVILKHTNPSEKTTYAHLSKISVQVGQSVSVGTVIGKVGSTGNSTGPHLHFELRPLVSGSWSAINPLNRLSRSVTRLINPPTSKKPMDYDLPNCEDVFWGRCLEIDEKS